MQSMSKDFLTTWKFEETLENTYTRETQHRRNLKLPEHHHDGFRGHPSLASKGLLKAGQRSWSF